MAVDITLRSALTSNGDPRPGAAREDGIACNGARVDKERKYGELTEGNRCRLVVVALETGGRWSVEALQFVESLAHTRARERPPTMARSAFLAWRRRWSRMVSVSCSRAFATFSLGGPKGSARSGWGRRGCPRPRGPLQRGMKRCNRIGAQNTVFRTLSLISHSQKKKVQVLFTALDFSALPMGTAFNQALGVLVSRSSFPPSPCFKGFGGYTEV